MINLLYLAIGYLLGSIPFALVIGKLFYKKDVREFGSGNLGGSNAGRVLGKKAGAIVTVLDVIKSFSSVLIASYISYQFNLGGTAYLAGLGAVIGHCYPIFARFKGGKAVAVSIGFLLGTNLILFLVTVISFFLILKLTKIVSASSILAFIIACIVAPFVGFNLDQELTLILITLFMIYRHRANIKRILNHTENKVTWI